MAIPNERHGHSPRCCALQQAGKGRCGRNCEKGHGPTRDLSAWESISGDAVHVAWYSGGITLVLPSLQEGTQACPVFLPHGDTMTLAWGTGYSSVRTGMLNILPHSQCRISSRLNFVLASRAGRSLIPVLLSLLERHGPHFPTHPFSSWFTLFQFCLLCASLIICIYFTEPQCVKRDFSEPFRVSPPVVVSHHPWALLSLCTSPAPSAHRIILLSAYAMAVPLTLLFSSPCLFPLNSTIPCLDPSHSLVHL